ncbi:MAG: hypothetical protein AAF502_19045 [Bacteroidota bacterium]
MKFYFKVAFSLAIIFYSSCSKTAQEQPNDENFTVEMPALPDWIELDLNDDGSVDYLLEYRIWDVKPINTSEGDVIISGQITPNGTNQVLVKNEEPNLFLRDLNEVKETVNEPLFWDIGDTRQFISIRNNSEGTWPIEWKVNSNTLHSTYFFGLKILNDNKSLLGWIEIELNTNNGSVRLINKDTL